MKSRLHAQKLITYLLYLLPLFIIIELLTISFGSNGDETFTLSLIHHSYNQIINIDSFDVHPPFYYLVLKLFLQITTFWTKSITAKIIFARVFSLLSFLITFYFLIQILYICGIDINWKIQLVLYLLYPSILGYSVTIRMYQLATMFIVLEIYGLLLFKYETNKKGLILSGISLLLALYTNYFAAAFAGAIIFIEFVKYCIDHNINKAIKLVVIGLIDIILFSLYLPITLHQINYVSSKGYYNDSNNIVHQLIGTIVGKPMTISKISEILCTMLLIVEVILIIYVCKRYNNKCKSLLIDLIFAYVLGLIPSIVLSFISHPMIQWRYCLPIFSVIYFILISVITNYIDNYELNHSLLIIMSFAIVLLCSLSSAVKVSMTTIPGNLKAINDTHFIKHTKPRKINVNGRYTSSNTGKICRESVYLSNNNKQLIMKHAKVSSVLAKNNRSLFTKVFSNIDLKGKSN